MSDTRVIANKDGAFEVGDIIDFSLNDGEEVQAMAVRQDTDGMVFLLMDCLRDEYAMNETGYNNGGYLLSDLRKKLNGKILDRFPADLRQRMIPFENKDLLRLPTEKEITGENFYGEKEPASVEQFKPMRQCRNSIASQGKSGGTRQYWLQNKTESSGTSFVLVGNYGYVSCCSAFASLGVRPAFKIECPERKVSA